MRIAGFADLLSSSHDLLGGSRKSAINTKKFVYDVSRRAQGFRRTIYHQILTRCAELHERTIPHLFYVATLLRLCSLEDQSEGASCDIHRKRKLSFQALML